eukprot:45112-Prorocentrum_minimum.AAC.1
MGGSDAAARRRPIGPIGGGRRLARAPADAGDGVRRVGGSGVGATVRLSFSGVLGESARLAGGGDGVPRLVATGATLVSCYEPFYGSSCANNGKDALNAPDMKQINGRRTPRQSAILSPAVARMSQSRGARGYRSHIGRRPRPGKP